MSEIEWDAPFSDEGPCDDNMRFGRRQKSPDYLAAAPHWNKGSETGFNAVNAVNWNNPASTFN